MEEGLFPAANSQSDINVEDSVMKLYPCLVKSILVLTLTTGCENVDKSIQNFEKARAMIENSEKKIIDKQKEVEKSVRRLLERESGESDAKKSKVNKQRDNNESGQDKED